MPKVKGHRVCFTQVNENCANIRHAVHVPRGLLGIVLKVCMPVRISRKYYS